MDEFASDHATVVVGTVIDPDLTDELRVTIVATGLGLPLEHRPNVIVDNTARQVTSDGASDYSRFDKPTVMRQQQARERTSHEVVEPERELEGRDLDYLDIPAFLRRQAD